MIWQANTFLNRKGFKISLVGNELQHVAPGRKLETRLPCGRIIQAYISNFREESKGARSIAVE